MSALKDQIAKARTTLQKAQANLGRLEALCVSHRYVKSGDSATCSICLHSGGWWCPTSKTHTCSYPDGEYCKYCGEPEERK